MGTPRAPLPSDFSSTGILTITPPPNSKPPTNILILLHGLGDTSLPFSTLGSRLQLPETSCISVRGPAPLSPFFLGSESPAFHWGDDILFDPRHGSVDPDAGFTKSVSMLTKVLNVLMEKCHFPPRNIMFLGFGQGGMAALAVVASAAFRDKEMGGVISIGGKLPAEVSSAGAKVRTPVLLCGGSKSAEVTRSAVDRIKERFGDVEYIKWDKGEDSMPSNRDEMLPLMRFFGRRLKSRAGVPEGAVEV